MRKDLMEFRVDCVTTPELVARIKAAAQGSQPQLILNHNIRALSTARSNPEMREALLRADTVHIDGMPIVFALRLAGIDVKGCHRTAYLDFMPALWEQLSSDGGRAYLLGAAPGVAAAASEVLLKGYSGVEIRSHHGFFDRYDGSPEVDAVVKDILAFDPDVVLLGLGMPEQEIFAITLQRRLQRGALLSCGGYIDFIAGRQTPAPRWLGPLGLEWLYRLVRDPRRLAKRYLIEPWPTIFDLTRFIVDKRLGRRRDMAA